ncbi:MAG: type I-C CRISPR-associated protein Cas5, partial [Ruminococcus sp.]|nr:type I-C CRISPR-associated protein Cas5 [Ruminococcus sp.]
MKGFRILAEGDYALFTRPELKVERVSYDVPPPGALEGMLKSVYWKPAIRYVIDKIIVFNPIRFANIRRNELKDKVSLPKIKSQMNGKGGDPCIYTAEERTQRASMLLKDVCYGIEFHFEMTGIRSDRDDE